MTAILLIGTADTKQDELLFLRDCMQQAGAAVRIMDVGVLEPAAFTPDISNAQVAAAAATTLADIIASGDENTAMTKMAEGATTLAARLHAASEIDGMIALGGSMGTDLALDVANALPVGMPKFVISTIAFSPLIPAERIAPDVMMILWSGGLYGLNSVCRAALSQAAGAVVGAAKAVEKPQGARPLIGMSSLGKSCLSYMVALKPELEKRGYELAVFHTTGMGGRAMEGLARQGRFACMFDFSLQEISNHLNGSMVSAGESRLEGAGAAGIPQIIAPGAIDMIDLACWQPLPDRFNARNYHAHNRLIASVNMAPEERRAAAKAIAAKLAKAKGPTALLLPLQGIEEWDKPGAPMHDPDAHALFCEEIRRTVSPPVALIEIDAHINDAAFAAAALQVFDRWVAEGKVVKGSV